MTHFETFLTKVVVQGGFVRFESVAGLNYSPTGYAPLKQARYARTCDLLSHYYMKTGSQLCYTVRKYSILRGDMKIKMVRMRKLGVEIPRRMLSDRYTVVSRGMLTIMDVTDQGLRRPVKVARLRQTAGHIYELIDPHILWASDGRFTLTGFERVRNDTGEAVDYAQSWLCILDNEVEDAFDADVRV